MRISRLLRTLVRSYSHYNDGNDKATQDENYTHLVHDGDGRVKQTDKRADDPRDRNVGDKCMPSYGSVVRVMECIHLDQGI